MQYIKQLQYNKTCSPCFLNSRSQFAKSFALGLQEADIFSRNESIRARVEHAPTGGLYRENCCKKKFFSFGDHFFLLSDRGGVPAAWRFHQSFNLSCVTWIFQLLYHYVDNATNDLLWCLLFWNWCLCFWSVQVFQLHSLFEFNSMFGNQSF